MSEDNSLVLIERPAPGVLQLKLNRPEARNALSAPLRKALARAFQDATDDDQAQCILLCGSDRCFAAGADLKEIAKLSPSDVRGLKVLRYWKVIADCPKPIVAAVAGPALGGGCELALHADIVVAARSARFGLPEITLGLMPGGGGTQRLVRAVGHYRAMRMMLTGEPVGAEEAYRLGFVTDVVEDEQLMEEALRIATKIASASTFSSQSIKEAALAGADAALGTGLMLERRSFELLFDTAEQKQGIQAFLDRQGR